MRLADFRVKEDVDPRGIAPVMYLPILVAYIQACHMDAEIVYISSVADGQHSPKSLHYAGMAVDLDVPGWTRSDFIRWAERTAFRLPRCYDIVGESTHMHSEYQPKRV